MNIPLVHVQGGEVTGSGGREGSARRDQAREPAPVATARAAERVVRMGEDPETVHVTVPVTLTWPPRSS